MSKFRLKISIATCLLLLGSMTFVNGQEADGKAAEAKTAESKVDSAKADTSAKSATKDSEVKTEETAKGEAKPEIKAEEKSTENTPAKTEATSEPKAAAKEVDSHKADAHKNDAHASDAKSATAKATAGHGEDHGHAGDSHGHGLTAENTDLSHGNGTSQLNSPAEFRFDLAIATALVFLVLLTILTKFAWGPISQALDSREHHIADMISVAEKNAFAEQRMKELEAQLAAQAEAAREAINAARQEGEIQKEKIIAQARQAAEHEKNRALADIHDAKNLALREIAQKSVNTAVDLAKNIIRREVKAEDHKQLIQDSLAQFQKN